MRLIEKYHEDGKPVYKTITWDEHSCEGCAKVDLDKTATFVNACAMGSRLLQEKALQMQAPIEKKKKAEVLEWAKKAGTFKTK